MSNSRNREKSILKGYNMLLYFAGSMIMYEPTEECVTDFFGKNILKNLPVSSNNPHFIKAASDLRESCIDKKTCRDMLRDDYTRLFDPDYLPMAPPYESRFISGRHTMSETKVRDVTGFYDAYGWRSALRNKKSDDHLGIELLFLTLLTDKYMDMDDPVNRREMRNEILRYINLHLLSWIKDWNSTIQDHARTLCYRGIGMLILASVEDIHSQIESHPDQESDSCE